MMQRHPPQRFKKCSTKNRRSVLMINEWKEIPRCLSNKGNAIRVAGIIPMRDRTFFERRADVLLQNVILLERKLRLIGHLPVVLVKKRIAAVC